MGDFHSTGIQSYFNSRGNGPEATVSSQLKHVSVWFDNQHYQGLLSKEVGRSIEKPSLDSCKARETALKILEKHISQ